MTVHLHATWKSNLYSERLSACGISGYQTVGTTPNGKGWNTARVGKGLTFGKPSEVTCGNCKRILNGLIP